MWCALIGFGMGEPTWVTSFSGPHEAWQSLDIKQYAIVESTAGGCGTSMSAESLQEASNFRGNL
jgi:hypothetical protein